MNRGAREKLFHKALRELSGRLIFFENDRDHESWVNCVPNGSIHIFLE